jgi:hypothetical protein
MGNIRGHAQCPEWQHVMCPLPHVFVAQPDSDSKIAVLQRNAAVRTRPLPKSTMSSLLPHHPPPSVTQRVGRGVVIPCLYDSNAKRGDWAYLQKMLDDTSKSFRAATALSVRLYWPPWQGLPFGLSGHLLALSYCIDILSRGAFEFAFLTYRRDEKR